MSTTSFGSPFSNIIFKFPTFLRLLHRAKWFQCQLWKSNTRIGAAYNISARFGVRKVSPGRTLRSRPVSYRKCPTEWRQDLSKCQQQMHRFKQTGFNDHGMFGSIHVEIAVRQVYQYAKLVYWKLILFNLDSELKKKL